MNVTISASELRAAVDLAIQVLPKRRNYEVHMGRLKLEAGHDYEQLRVSAGDDDLNITIATRRSERPRGDLPDAIVVQHYELLSALSQLTDDRVQLRSGSFSAPNQAPVNALEIAAGDRKLALASSEPAPTGASPTGASPTPRRCYRVSAYQFAKLIRRTVFATDNESSRYALGGVLLELGPDRIVGVATDGRCLATHETSAVCFQVSDAEPAPPSPECVIVPARTMRLVAAATEAASPTEDIQIVPDGLRAIRFELGCITIRSSLLDGRFPKWRDAFPVGDPIARINLPAREFVSAVRWAGLATNEDRRRIAVRFDPGKGIHFSGCIPGVASAAAECAVEYDGPPFSLFLDPRYLSDFFDALDPSGTVTMELRDPKTCVVFSTPDGCRYLQMPITRKDAL